MRAWIGIAGIAALAGCVNKADTSVEAGARAFADNCAACHGVDGRGSGSFGRQLITQPPDLTTLSARNGGVFPRDEVASTIDGYARGAHFSAAMPEFGAGDMGPTVIVENADGTATPIPAELLALVTYLEAIQRDPG